jgi:hypothetical protein
MTSFSQIEANRRNAGKVPGPTTERRQTALALQCRAPQLTATEKILQDCLPETCSNLGSYGISPNRPVYLWIDFLR